jgi:hypothetical protein
MHGAILWQLYRKRAQGVSLPYPAALITDAVNGETKWITFGVLSYSVSCKRSIVLTGWQEVLRVGGRVTAHVMSSD